MLQTTPVTLEELNDCRRRLTTLGRRIDQTLHETIRLGLLQQEDRLAKELDELTDAYYGGGEHAQD
jgi:hypothetical protein